MARSVGRADGRGGSSNAPEVKTGLHRHASWSSRRLFGGYVALAALLRHAGGKPAIIRDGTEITQRIAATCF
jgi:hypothetical protein